MDETCDGPDLTAVFARADAVREHLDHPDVITCERDRELLVQEVARLREMVKWMGEKIMVQADLLAVKKQKIEDALKAGGD